MNDAESKGYGKGKEVGIAEGRAEGRAEGAKQEKIAIARAMKQHGDDIDYIAAITGLTPDELSKI